MSEPIALIILPLAAVSLVVLFVVMGALFPRQIADVKSKSSDMPGRSFLLGLINAVFLSVIVAALSGGGNFLQIVALERLMPDSTRIRQASWGSALMVVASFTPLIGWFLLFPYLSFRGLGAFLLSLLTKNSD
jgi:hypothetical protein